MIVRALLFTDVVDSTRMVERLGDARAAEVWSEHDRRARDLLAVHRGREIGRADGFFLVFDDSADAARYALAYHRELMDLPLAARVGLHVGPVTLRANIPEHMARGAQSTEVEGLATPLTARVMALSGAGQTLLTAAAREALDGKLPDTTRIQSHGHYRLKGVEEPVEIFELGVRASSPFSPPADVEKAYRVVRVGDLWLPIREVRHNLPAERDAFVGRTRELRALAAQLDTGTRLVTVLGPGGTGKTRFVRRYARTWLGDWPGGVYFCDLSEARSPDGIFFAVASALEVPLGKDHPAAQLGHAIAGRGDCLVILDNFEQVVEYARGTLGGWLDQAPDAAFVVTSRERLYLSGEELFPIEPLPLQMDAIELFVARARAQKPDFVLSDSNRAAVAEVVRLLDGLPLAIELAAARVRVLSPTQIVQRLRDRFLLLAGARGMAARQATMRAAIDWSWELLTPWEQAAFAQCSIFDGGFTLEAAEAVLDLSRWPEAPPAIDVVQALTDKSLLRSWVPAAQTHHDIEEPYFGMYISIHEYAAEKLEASGKPATRAAEERHGQYFARFGSDHAIEALSLRGGVKRRRALTLEVDNLAAACRRAVARADGEIAVAAYRTVWEVLEVQGPCALGLELGAQVLAVDTLDAAQRAAALYACAKASRLAGRSDEAAAALEQALALSREVGDRRCEASVLHTLGNLRRDQGQMADARTALEHSLALSREVGNRGLEGHVIGNLGILHAVQGRFEEARAHFEQALAIHQEVGNRRMEGVDTTNLGSLHLDQGKTEEAGAQFERALAIHREVGNRREEAILMVNLGALSNGQGRLNEAWERFKDALTMVREVGDRLVEGAALDGLGDVLVNQGRTDEARTYLEQALAIHRAVGNRRAQGSTLGKLGALSATEGRFGQARELLRSGAALLREVGDHSRLAAVLCDLGHAEFAGDDLGAARAALADAERTAGAIGAGSDRELGRNIAALRSKLA